MKMKTGGEAIIDAVVSNGVEVIFGIPGAQIYPLFDGIYKSNIKLIVPKHEQAAAYMAMGYAKSSHKVGVFSVVPGPGILNTTAALCTAMGNCSAMVGLTGQIPSSFLGMGRGHLHELKDQSATLKSIIKDALVISKVSDTSSVVNEAFKQSQTDRPGPITVEMCWDTMATEDTYTIEKPSPVCRPVLNNDEINEALKLIKQSKKIMIMCGSGAQHASEEVKKLSQILNAPVTGFRGGRGIVSEDHPLGVNPLVARQLWEDTDLLIGIGSRLEMPYMRWTDYMTYEKKPKGGPKLLRIDIDEKQFDIFEPDLGVLGDSKDVCRTLCDNLEGGYVKNDARLHEIEQFKNLADKELNTVQPQMSYLSVIRKVLPRDGILVPELSQFGFATWAGCFPIYEPKTYIEGGFQGTLGYGYATALGAKVANPDKVVVSISGDGGFMFGVQELMTASENNIAVIAIVVNNQSYGNVRRDQEIGFGSRFAGSELMSPDFQKISEGFGVSYKEVKSPLELEIALKEMIEKETPSLIEIKLERGEETSPWQYINATTPLN